MAWASRPASSWRKPHSGARPCWSRVTPGSSGTPLFALGAAPAGAAGPAEQGSAGDAPGSVLRLRSDAWVRMGGTDMFEKILLAVDESSSSSRAVPLAAELAERFHAEIVVVEVPDPDPGVDRSPELSSETLGGAPPLVDRVVMDLKDAGMSARPELWIGPGDEIGAAMAHV